MKQTVMICLFVYCCFNLFMWTNDHKQDQHCEAKLVTTHQLCLQGNWSEGGPQHVTCTDHRVTPPHRCTSLQRKCTKVVNCQLCWQCRLLLTHSLCGKWQLKATSRQFTTCVNMNNFFQNIEFWSWISMQYIANAALYLKAQICERNQSFCNAWQ